MISEIFHRSGTISDQSQGNWEEVVAKPEQPSEQPNTGESKNPLQQVDQATDAQIVDLAGRQRMLSQRFAMELLAQELGVDTPLAATLELITHTARAFHLGGDAILAPGQPPLMVRLDPPPTAQIRSLAEKQEKLVGELAASAEAIAQASSKPQSERISAYKHLLKVSESFHRCANLTVLAFSAHFQQQKELMERRMRELQEWLKEMTGKAPQERPR